MSNAELYRKLQPADGNYASRIGEWIYVLPMIKNLHRALFILCVVLLLAIPIIQETTSWRFSFAHLLIIIGILSIAVFPELIRIIQLRNLSRIFKLNFRSNISLKSPTAANNEDEFKINILSGAINGHHVEVFDDLSTVSFFGFNLVSGRRTRVFLDGRHYKDMYGAWYASAYRIKVTIQELQDSWNDHR